MIFIALSGQLGRESRRLIGQTVPHEDYRSLIGCIKSVPTTGKLKTVSGSLWMSKAKISLPFQQHSRTVGKTSGKKNEAQPQFNAHRILLQLNVPNNRSSNWNVLFLAYLTTLCTSACVNAFFILAIHSRPLL